MEGEPMQQTLKEQNHVKKLRTHGYVVLKSVIEKDVIEHSRRQVVDNLSLFKNTRPNPSSRHLAGFHRYPELESLHTALSSNKSVLELLNATLQGKGVRTIGLSDITINRSQKWHKDLLRGRFSSYIDNESICWEKNVGDGYKILLYLQSGSSLKVICGSHLLPISLENDSYSEPDDETLVESIPVEAGDIVVMDIRTSHRGSSEEVYPSEESVNNPRILISTVLGCIDSALTKEMELGNLYRMMDWMERNS